MSARPGNLLVLGERAALAWVLTEQRMAFPAHRAREADALRPGDPLLLYTTRGCFHNPTRDRGRVMGEATVAGPARRLATPVAFGDHEFPIGCDLVIERIAPFGRGVELAPLVDRLRAFPDPRSWSARMRRALVPLPAADLRLLRRRLEPLLVDRAAAVPSYIATLPDSRSPRSARLTAL